MWALGSRYVLDEPIGYGASGRVWRGRQLDDGGAVAIKVLREELAADPSVVARFLQERAILLSVTGPHIVSLRDVVVEGQTLALVMDLVPDGDLRDMLREHGPAPVPQALRIAADIAQGLAVVHAAGVVHRDVKPENVLVDTGGGQPEVFLTDFGVSRIVEGSVVTQGTGMVGTPAYLAPEVAMGERPTADADIYSLGIVAYELIAGAPPFTGQHPLAVIRAHADQAPERPAGISDAVWDVLSALLAKNPAERPASAVIAAGLLRAAATGAPAGPAPVPTDDTISRGAVVPLGERAETPHPPPARYGTDSWPEPIGEQLTGTYPAEGPQTGEYPVGGELPVSDDEGRQETADPSAPPTALESPADEGTLDELPAGAVPPPASTGTPAVSAPPAPPLQGPWGQPDEPPATHRHPLLPVEDIPVDAGHQVDRVDSGPPSDTPPNGGVWPSVNRPPAQRDPPRPRPGRALGAAVIALVVLAVAGIATAVVVQVRHRATPAPTQASFLGCPRFNLAQRQAAASSAPTPTPAPTTSRSPRQDDRRSTDPTPLTTTSGSLARKQQDFGSCHYTQVAAQQTPTCATALTGIATQEAKAGQCTQVLRFTYVDSDKLVVVQESIVNLIDVTAAARAADDIGRGSYGYAAALPGPAGSGAESLSDRTPRLAISFNAGHWLLMTSASYVDGRAVPTGTHDYVLENALRALAEQTLFGL